MTFAEFYFTVKGRLKAEGRSSEDEDEISEEEFLAVLAEEMEAGRA